MTAEAEARARVVGGRYRIRREVGRGTMGVVYEAEDERLGETVALKTIELAYAVALDERKAFEQRFLNEARVAALLAHPNVVSLRDVGRDPEDGTLFMALEFLHGRTLAELSAGGSLLHWREALQIVARLADALHAAHAQGIVHRDIKPANVMLLPSGEPKLMDFGIAKLPASQLTAAGEVFGTPAYMSPEQALDERLDARSDLFSLGTVLYELLTGLRAFPGDCVPRILGLVVRQDPPPPSRMVPGLPTDLDYVVARCLSKRPADRYADGRALAEDVEDLLAARPPRHRAGWVPGPRVEEAGVAPLELHELGIEDAAEDLSALRAETLPAVDIEAELETLVAHADRARSWRRLVGAAWARRAALAAALLAIAALAASLRSGAAPAGPPPADPASVLGSADAVPSWPSVAEVEAARPEPPLPGPDVSARAASRPALPPRRAARDASGSAAQTTWAPSTPPAGPPTARLVYDFEHPLKSATLRLWLDGRLLLEEDLEGQESRGALGFKRRKGRLEDVVEVTPGPHEIRAQVAWEGKRKEKTLSGDFSAAATRQLEIRLGRLRKGLSLAWK